MRIFVAGATGAVGQHLVPALVLAGHQVTGSTRSTAKAEQLHEAGATPAVLDGLDRDAILRAVADAKPDVIIHQMTSLANLRNFRKFDQEFAVTNELRTKGIDYLLEAAEANHVSRFIAQSYIGWNNPRTGGPVKTEDDLFDPDPLPGTAQTLHAIQHVEAAVPAAGGVALRYANLYGPGASRILTDMVRKRRLPIVGSGAGIWSFTEVSDAAGAAIAAISNGAPGVYNIVDDEPAPVTQWLPYLAECLRAKRPMRLPAWLGRLAAGEFILAQMTQARGSSNAKARRDLGWQPAYASWRDGFPAWIRAAK
jgi:2-alkyl-3-oxoalkanoate reductase